MATEKQLAYWKSKEGKKLSEEHRKKISIANTGIKRSQEYKEKLRLANLGKHHSEETKIKIGLASKGRKASEATKEKMRKRMLGNQFGFKKGQVSFNKGKKTPPEVLEKLKISHLGQVAWNKGKKGLFKHTEEHKKRISEMLKGRVISEASREKLRIATINYIKRVCNGMTPRIGHNETQLLDDLEKELGFKIVRQFNVAGYFIDGYVPELNLVIEIDECYHERRKDKDLIREAIIKNKLNCKFMRIKDYD